MYHITFVLLVYSCIFRNFFILVRVIVEPEPVPDTLGVSQEYTLLGWQFITIHHAHTHSHMHSHVGVI